MYSPKEVSVDHQLAGSGSQEGRKWLWISATAVIVVFTISMRMTLNFHHTMAPGMDAANYPMQTQWLLQHGELQKPDRPLIFWLNAYVTKLLMLLTDLTLGDAAMLASRLIDGFCQPWTALPIMMLAYTWSQGRRSAIPLSAAAAVLAVMSPPILRMAGDFQKNSLGLVWMALSMWAVRESLAHPRSVWRWAQLALIFSLVCVTHVGAFGVTAVMLVGSLVGYALLGNEQFPSRHRLLLAVAPAAVLTLLALGIWWIDPSKIRSFSDLPSMLAPRLLTPSMVITLIVYAVMAMVVRKLWSQRHELQRCDLAIAMGTICGLVVLVLPVLEERWALRFFLMTPIPAAILLAFVATKLEMDLKSPLATKGLIMVICLLALAAPLAMQGPILSVQAARELGQLRSKIAKPSETLVLAPHGLQLWAGYLMQTQVRSRELPEDLTPFDRVLILEPKGETAGHRPPRPGRGKPPERERREPPNFQLKIPANAKQIYSSDLFTLYEVDR